MKGKKGYLKRCAGIFARFTKIQKTLKKSRVKQDGIKPDSFKKEKFSHSNKRSFEIYKLAKKGMSLDKISDALWGENYNPFYTMKARDTYLNRAIENGSRFDIENRKRKVS
jgi:hypothetical protein